MNANENMNPVMNAETMSTEQPVVAPITEQPVMEVPVEQAPQVETAAMEADMPPLSSEPYPLPADDMPEMVSETAAPVYQQESTNDEANPTEDTSSGADALEAQLQQQRTQSQHHRTGPKARPIHFNTTSQETIHRADPNFRYIDPEEQKRKRCALDIYQSFNSSRYLQGSVKGVRPVFDRRRGESNDNMSYYAIVSYGPYQVYIPDFKFSTINQNDLLTMYRVNNPTCTMADAMHAYLTSRLGAEIDFIIDQLPEDCDLDNNSIVGGDRASAMRRKRIQYWYGTNSDGTPHVNENDLAAARVVAVSRGSVRIELYGVESTIPARELSWSMIQDAREDERFTPGNIIIVRITQITRNQEDDYAVIYAASVKRAEKDRRIEAMKIYTVDSVANGEIRYVEPPRQDHPNGRIFVELEKGVQCMCQMMTGSTPPLPGTRVRVQITRQDPERYFLFGRILYPISKPTNIQL